MKTKNLNFLEMVEANKEHAIVTNGSDPIKAVTYTKGFWHRQNPQSTMIHLCEALRTDYEIKVEPKKISLDFDLRAPMDRIDPHAAVIANFLRPAQLASFVGRKWKIEATEILE